MVKKLKTQIGGQPAAKKKQAVIFAVVAFAVLVVATAILTLTPVGSFITGSFAKQAKCPVGTSHVCAHPVVGANGKTVCYKYQCMTACPKSKVTVCTGTYSNASCECVNPPTTSANKCPTGYSRVCVYKEGVIANCECKAGTSFKCPMGETPMCPKVASDKGDNTGMVCSCSGSGTQIMYYPPVTPAPTCQAGYIQACTADQKGITTCKCIVDTRPTTTATPIPTTSICPVGYTSVCATANCTKKKCIKN